MEKMCKYCGKVLTDCELKKNALMCGTCGHKSTLIPRYIKARDDLRERLCLKRIRGDL